MEINFKIINLDPSTLDTKLDVVDQKDESKLGFVEVSLNELQIYVYSFMLTMLGNEVLITAESKTLASSGVISYNPEKKNSPGRVTIFKY